MIRPSSSQANYSTGACFSTYTSAQVSKIFPPLNIGRLWSVKFTPSSLISFSNTLNCFPRSDDISNHSVSSLRVSLKFVGVQSLIILAIGINRPHYLPPSKLHRFCYQSLSAPTQDCIRTWQGPHILALVIGINKYTSPTHSCLQGAVADANIFEQFLREGLKVSDANIINLRDEQASRASILSAFTSLRDDKKYKKDDAAIIIFYAGHGARTKIPQNWEREGWNTSSGHIELLCPSDIGCPILAANGEESKDIVQGIPDRTISFLLNQISDAKGNNIVSIV